MSFLHASVLAGASGNQGPYQIEQSLRFNKADTPYLNKVFTSAGDEQKFTISFWFKTTNVGNSTASNLAGAGDDGNNYFLIDIEKTSVGEFLHIFNYTPATGYEFDLKTTRLLRDSSAWMHLVLAVDTTQATASDRAKVWLNGVRETSFTTENYPNQNRTTMWWGGNTSNGTALASQETAIGRRPPGGPEYANAYIAEFNSIDGQYLTHEDFGEFDNNGVWRPIEYAGTYTGNSFYLKFDAADVDGDSSGLGNDFTAHNFTTSGAGTDVMSDTPTTNWCTLNPLNRAVNDLFDGNLVATRVSGTGFAGATGTLAVSSGKWYYEVTASTAAGMIGMVASSWTVNLNSALWYNNATGYGFYGVNGNRFNNGSNSAYGSAWSADDVIGVAMDLDNGAIYFAINNTWQNSGDPTSGSSATGAAYSSIAANEFTPVVYAQDATAGDFPVTANFGQRDFAYTPPTGYKALNTANLPAPDIKDGSDYFQTITYSGTSAARSLTVANNSGNGWQPDLVWIKSRNDGYYHRTIDAVRGATKEIYPNDTNVEATVATSLTSFNSDGFSLGSSGGVNETGKTFVAWNWLAGNGTSSNTAGSITSTVSANPTAGFSIVGYTGNATSGATIGHGLGVAPSMVIVKNRDDGTTHWHVYHEAIGNTKYLLLSIDNVATTASNRWNDTSPSSSVVTLGDHVSVNGSSDNMIAYCFAEVEGYSKISEFTGNGVTDGSFVYCGFKPSWILLRRYAASRNWYLYDAARNTFNVVGNVLYPDLQDIEASADALDILSNGFKMRTTNTSTNGSGDKILFVALASNPFGGSGVSPATAR